jgi:anaerobic magnesium-protoporphyrin IX monomethyl ester cyclase
LGIAYILNGALQRNPKRSVIKELDLLGTPAWDLIDIPAYKQIWMDAHGYFGLNIATTRGCPYKCNWCAKPIYGNRYNSRSPQAVVSEIKMLVSHFGAEYLWVCDDIFGLKPGWVQAFRDELQKNDLVIKYKIQSRVDLLLEGDNIDALAKSGLHEVWVGAESGSQKILDAMDKGTQVNEIYTATKLLQSKGIRVAFFLQFGYLGEEMDDIQKTVDMLLELMPDDIGVSVSYPLPGTKFYEKVKDDLMAKSNWVDSDDLDMMYKANYSRRFYKRLHRYIHKMYRGKQAIIRAKQLAKKPHDFRRSDVYKLLSLGYYVPGAIIDKWRLNRLAQVVQ